MAIEYEVRDRIAYIAFCRPEKHNALRDEDLADFIEAVAKLDQNESADIGIVHGQGPSFSSGADIAARLQRSLDEKTGSHRVNEVDAVLGSTICKPLIAAVHGYCLGHAMVTAFLCDHVIAERGTKFQVTETAIGIPAPTMWHQLGHGAFANEVVMTGRFFTADEANRAGALAKLVDDGTHLAAAEELARAILQQPQSTIRELVRIRRHVLASTFRDLTSIARPSDWATNADSSRRIAEMLARVTHSKPA